MTLDLFTESPQVAEAARPGGALLSPDAPAEVDRTSIEWFAMEQDRLRREGEASAKAFLAQKEIRAAAQEGIDRAVSHAERDVPGWSDVAFAFVKLHAMRNRGKTFTGHDVVRASVEYGVIQPPTSKAWGGPLQRAARAGVIVKAGTVADNNPERHGSMVPLWRAA